MPETPLMLNYARQRPPRWRRVGLVFLTLIAILYRGIVGGRQAIRKWHMLRAESACLHFEVDSTRTNYDSSHDADQRLDAFLRLLPGKANTDFYGCVFLGKLRNRHGDRLVVVNRWTASGNMLLDDFIDAQVIIPGSAFREPKSLPSQNVNCTRAAGADAYCVFEVNRFPDMDVGVRSDCDSNHIQIHFAFLHEGKGTIEC
jgi:hypothetical protein